MQARSSIDTVAVAYIVCIGQLWKGVNGRRAVYERAKE